MNRNQKLQRSGDIRRYILDYVEKKPTGITGAVVGKFKISRQAATRYLTQMVQDGRLMAKGTTRGRSYLLGITRLIEKKYVLNSSLDESRVWTEDFRESCQGVRENVLKICEYGFTEMVNNAIDHSNGRILNISFERTHRNIYIIVEDDGVGIFRKIKEKYNLPEESQSILELSKGKITTDPAKHTGEGIFFSSRAFNFFAINSHGLSFSHSLESKEDFLFDAKDDVNGTHVYMRIDMNTKNVLSNVFMEFNNPENNYAFEKTIVPVRFVQQKEEELISRSQAKRLLARVENFKTVMLDFEGVKNIGPAFADEIFRVYKNEHPEIKLVPSNASREVMKMIRRAQAAAGVIEK